MENFTSDAIKREGEWSDIFVVDGQRWGFRGNDVMPTPVVTQRIDVPKKILIVTDSRLGYEKILVSVFEMGFNADRSKIRQVMDWRCMRGLHSQIDVLLTTNNHLHHDWSRIRAALIPSVIFSGTRVWDDEDQWLQYLVEYRAEQRAIATSL